MLSPSLYRALVHALACCFLSAAYADPAKSDGINANKICEINIRLSSHAKIITVPIALVDLKNRVDRERFAACPYIVSVKTKHAKIRLDFNLVGSVTDLSKEETNRLMQKPVNWSRN